MCGHRRFCNLNPNKLKYKFIPKNQYSKPKDLGMPVPISPQKGTNTKGTPRTESEKANLRTHAINRGLGGVRPSKRILYNNVHLGSTYEVAVAKDLDANNIRWSTCKRINYIDPFGKKRTYTPDLYLIDYDVYLDPKNDFLLNNINPGLGFTDSEKIKLVENQNKIKILILDKNNLTWSAIKRMLNINI
jgi:hypothetical protein